MKRLVLMLTVLSIVGIAAAAMVDAGVMGDAGDASSHKLPYGWYRVAPLVNVVKPPPPPPPPPSGGVNIGGGNTPRLLRGGEADNTDAGAKQPEAKKDDAVKPPEPKQEEKK